MQSESNAPASSPPRNRLWFRFSLRTLFVLITLVALPCGWVAWEASIVRHRRTMRAAIEKSGAFFFSGDVSYPHSKRVITVRQGNLSHYSPVIRRWFGDEGAVLIGFNRRLTDDDCEAIKAFPEAEVMAIP